MGHIFLNLRWQDLVDILLVAIIIYQVVLALKGTRAIQVLAGLILLFLAYLVARRLEFFTLEWLLDIIVKSFVLIVIILFQADIRRLLSRVGKKALAPGGEQTPGDHRRGLHRRGNHGQAPHRGPGRPGTP